MAWDYVPDASALLVRCASHRAREKLQRLSPTRLISYFSYETHCAGGFVLVPIELLPAAVDITGCSRASLRYSYHPCR